MSGRRVDRERLRLFRLYFSLRREGGGVAGRKGDRQRLRFFRLYFSQAKMARGGWEKSRYGEAPIIPIILFLTWQEGEGLSGIGEEVSLRFFRLFFFLCIETIAHFKRYNIKIRKKLKNI